MLGTLKRLLTLLFLIFGTAAYAQEYPSKPLRLIIPVPPGGGTDILGRQMARKLGESFGQQVVVDNRPGAGTVIGSELLAKSAPDGYTLSVNINVLVVHPSLPVRSVREFVALARTKPDQIAYASSGVGGAAYLAAEFLKLKTGIRMIHVPYKGTVPALNALISGETQAMVAALPGTIPFIQAGRVRALGVTGAQRSPAMAELPTMI